MEQNPAALAAIRALRDLGGDAGGVLEGFATAKRMLEGRFKQYTSFLSQSPWNLVALLGSVTFSRCKRRDPQKQNFGPETIKGS